MRRMPSCCASSRVAVVPSLWRLEVANVLRNAVRRGRCDEAYVDRSLQRLSRFPFEVDDETSKHAWAATRTLSREQGLTSYDAAYLELAIRKSQPLATCDGGTHCRSDPLWTRGADRLSF